MEADKTYTERDARDWQRAMQEKDETIKALADEILHTGFFTKGHEWHASDCLRNVGKSVCSSSCVHRRTILKDAGVDLAEPSP